MVSDVKWFTSDSEDSFWEAPSSVWALIIDFRAPSSNWNRAWTQYVNHKYVDEQASCELALTFKRFSWSCSMTLILRRVSSSFFNSCKRLCMFTAAVRPFLRTYRKKKSRDRRQLISNAPIFHFRHTMSTFMCSKLCIFIKLVNSVQKIMVACPLNFNFTVWQIIRNYEIAW